jgi:hypothetical protein
MKYNRTSATNCARIYNDSFAPEEIASARPLFYSKRLQLDEGTVWNGVFLYWLIVDSIETQQPLTLQQNAPSQMARLQPALAMRNRRMAGTGQQEWNHACDLCCWVNQTEDGVKSMFFRLLFTYSCGILMNIYHSNPSLSCGRWDHARSTML